MAVSGAQSLGIEVQSDRRFQTSQWTNISPATSRRRGRRPQWRASRRRRARRLPPAGVDVIGVAAVPLGDGLAVVEGGTRHPEAPVDGRRRERGVVRFVSAGPVALSPGPGESGTAGQSDGDGADRPAPCESYIGVPTASATSSGGSFVLPAVILSRFRGDIRLNTVQNTIFRTGLRHVITAGSVSPRGNTPWSGACPR